MLEWILSYPSQQDLKSFDSLLISSKCYAFFYLKKKKLKLTNIMFFFIFIFLNNNNSLIDVLWASFQLDFHYALATSIITKWHYKKLQANITKCGITNTQIVNKTAPHHKTPLRLVIYAIIITFIIEILLFFFGCKLPICLNHSRFSHRNLPISSSESTPFFFSVKINPKIFPRKLQIS